MSKSRVIYILAFCIFASWSVTLSQNTLPFTNETIAPDTHPEPTDIKTDEAKHFDTKSNPLKLLGNGGNETVFVLNTGFSVEIILRNLRTTERAVGVILGDKTYVFYKIRFYWTNSTEKTPYTTFDGEERHHLVVVIQYYNTDYPSFRESLQHLDGLLKIIICVRLGTKDNPNFEILLEAMKHIRNPGQSYDLSLSDARSSFYNFPEDATYFVMPGAYTNESRAEIYYCATSVYLADVYAEISHKQFEEAFLKQLNREDEPLDNIETRYPLGDRPVVKSHTIITKVDRGAEYIDSKLRSS